ncbi:MAG: CopG family transcriptional regulator [Candidatus Kerfeldbacteria bacterium]|nr:CopG family transcriptional regulator [Candidatus Kerfeldbacteria bacterium]
MRSVITMSVPEAVKAKIDAISRNEHLPRSQVIQLALNEFFIKYEFDQIRKSLVPKAQKLGLFTDEDVFERLS